MRPLTRALLVAAVASLACTCNPSSTVEGPPRGAAQAEAPPPPPSIVAVPVTLSTDAIRAAVIAQVPKVVVDLKGEPLDRGIVADIKVTRTGEPDVRVNKKGVHVTVPLKVAATPRAGKSKKLKLGQVSGKLEVQVDLAPQLGQDWNLQPNPELSHTWTDEPTFAIGPIKVPVRGAIDPKLKDQLAEVEKQMRRDLPDELDLRGTVAGVWKTLGEPRKVADDPATWLAFTPDALYASDLVTDQQGVHVEVGAGGRLSLDVGRPAKVSVDDLPDRVPPPSGSAVRIATPITIDWDTLADALREQADGVAFTQDVPALGKARVTLTEVLDVYPTGRSVAVGVRVHAEASAVDITVDLWLSGRAEIRDDVLRIRDFDYVAKSDSVWFDTLHGAVAGPLRDRIAERLELPLGPRRDAVLADARKMLDDAPAREGIDIEATLSGVDLKGVRATDAGLVVQTELTGSLALTLVGAPAR